MGLGDVWEVLGGAGKGGILVRTQQDKASEPLPGRLSTGALVRELALDGERLHYELLSGTGPASGWVSIRTSEKSLLVLLSGVWQVVGGAEKGGIVVRGGQDVASEMLPHRLATGALVRELALVNERLQYELIDGAGPANGWVNIGLKGPPQKDLLVRVGNTTSDNAQGSSTREGGSSKGGNASVKDDWNPYAILGVAPDATDAQIKSAFRKMSLRVHPDHCPDDPGAAAKFRELTEVKVFLLDPRCRRHYNLTHGLLQTTVSVKWWSDWDEIFDEIAPAGEEELLPGPAPALASPDVRIDIMVLGATGHTGTLACMLLQRQTSGHSWAIAGRDGRKLALLEQKFGGGARFCGATRVETPDDLMRLARRARVVVDFTGPKFLLDGAVAEACVQSGAHLVDTTGCAGDAMTAADVRARLNDRAKAAELALVFFCGWSAAQVDFGTWMAVRHLREQHGLPTRRVDVYRWFQGSSCWGGTHMLAYRGQDDLEQRLKQGGPFFLGGRRPGGVRKEDEDEATCIQDKYSGMWVAIDSPPDNVVPRCSCELFEGVNEPYGVNFLYKNWGLWPDKGSGQMALLSNKFLRSGYHTAVKEGKIPPVGAGARERLRQESSITMVFVAEADESSDNPRKAYVTMVTGPGGMGDPNECTATIAVDAADCMLDALNTMQKGSLRSGFGTPAYHLAHLGFRDRLVARGNTYRTEDGVPPPELFRNIVSSAATILG